VPRSKESTLFTRDDLSKAMDIAGLSKLTSDTLVLVVAVLGFMEFGLATEEFEVTAERLGVYLPVVSATPLYHRSLHHTVRPAGTHR
jgi:hypothetical protein